MKQKAEPGPPSLFKKMKIKINKTVSKRSREYTKGENCL